MMRVSMFSLILLAVLSVPAAADVFDGKHPLLCTAFVLYQCDLESQCVAVKPEEVGAAGDAWTIDFRTKEVTSTTKGAVPNKIGGFQQIDGKLFLTGIQDGDPKIRDGAAWSVAINQPNGELTIAVAIEDGAFIGLGSCVPR